MKVRPATAAPKRPPSASAAAPLLRKAARDPWPKEDGEQLKAEETKKRKTSVATSQPRTLWKEGFWRGEETDADRLLEGERETRQGVRGTRSCKEEHTSQAPVWLSPKHSEALEVRTCSLRLRRVRDVSNKAFADGQCTRATEGKGQPGATLGASQRSVVGAGANPSMTCPSRRANVSKLLLRRSRSWWTTGSCGKTRPRRRRSRRWSSRG
eukprot:scaffold3719_cov247-Pinguiococcus_pyrenoidosus.AAC.12